MTWRMLTPFSGRVLSEAGDPFASLNRELSRAFDDMLTGRGLAPASVASSALRLDVKEDEKAFHVSADLPGLSEKEVEITFEDGTLTIRGEKKVERDEKGETWHIVERSSGSFARQLALPANIDEDRIEAKFDKGVLTVTLPKLPEEKAKTRKIEVKGG